MYSIYRLIAFFWCVDLRKKIKMCIVLFCGRIIFLLELTKVVSGKVYQFYESTYVRRSPSILKLWNDVTKESFIENFSNVFLNIRCNLFSR